MKNLLKISILFLSLVTSLVSCDDESVKFTAAPQGEFEFTNTFLVDYALPAENLTNNNIGAVFAFNAADFGIPTNVNYRLESSILGDFTDAMVVPTLSNANNQIEVSIGTLKSLATDYGYVAPNSGILNFRVRAYPGDGTSTVEMFTPKQVLNITLLEAISGGSGIEVASWGIVGSGYNDWGNAGSDASFYTTSQANVLVSYVTLVNGLIKFRENNDWGNNLGDNGADGTLEDGGADIAVTAGFYMVTLDLESMTYTMEQADIYGIVGSGYNDWGNAGPDFSFTPLSNNIWVAEIVTLVNGLVKFRVNQDWSTNFGDTGADGTLDAGGADIPVTAGNYRIILNLTDSTYQLNKIN